MKGHDDLERDLARWFEADGVGAARAGQFERAIDATRRQRPRPALVAWFGSAWVSQRRAGEAPRVSWGTAAVIVLTLLAVLTAAVLVGAQQRRLPLDQQTVIAYAGGTWGWDGSPTVTNHAIFSVAPDGDESRRLAKVPGEPQPNWFTEPTTGGLGRLGPVMRWSPDGMRIAFRLYNDEAGLYVINRDGSGLRLVAEATGEPEPSKYLSGSSFAWSPDGSRIAFISPELMAWPPNAARNGHLFVVDVDTGDVRELAGAANRTVAWSPDGSTIAFGRSQPSTSALVLINADGTGERSFEFSYLENNHPGAIAWSPDGSRIAFQQARFTGAGEGYYLMIVNSDGTEPRDAAYLGSGCCYHGAYGGLLVWSPDGKLIAAEGGVFAADGSGQRLSLNAGWVDWSPDGSQLVFAGRGVPIPGAPTEAQATAIYVIDADGTDQRWLADGDYPTWSP